MRVWTFSQSSLHIYRVLPGCPFIVDSGFGRIQGEKVVGGAVGRLYVFKLSLLSIATRRTFMFFPISIPDHPAW